MNSFEEALRRDARSYAATACMLRRYYGAEHAAWYIGKARECGTNARRVRRGLAPIDFNRAGS